MYLDVVDLLQAIGFVINFSASPQNPKMSIIRANPSLPSTVVPPSRTPTKREPDRALYDTSRPDPSRRHRIRLLEFDHLTQPLLRHRPLETSFRQSSVVHHGVAVDRSRCFGDHRTEVVGSEWDALLSVTPFCSFSPFPRVADELETRNVDADAGSWCWISSEYNDARLWLHYFFGKLLLTCLFV